ncbi:amidohydrolase [Carnobacterium sp. TMP28]|uniref:amidohydrolase n=1 Tax=Carnobacterium sp. TMP28 TaxID=3397060 RepID=UPI0039E0FA62
MVWIKNIRLETGYLEKEANDSVTTTDQVALKIENGTIQEIAKEVPAGIEGVIDGKNYLASPSLRDNHIHLDKGHYGGSWKAVVPVAGVKERIIEEEGFLVDFLQDAPKKAQALIDLICGSGATFLRVQVNLDPVIEMKNIELIREVLEKNSYRLDYELVAFPQHGTLKTQEKGLLSKAAKDDAINAMGGLDPATIDNDIEQSLETTFKIANENNKEIDIHLHDPGELGIYEIKRIVAFTKKYEMQGKVAITHAYSMGAVGEDSLLGVVKELAENQIAINTTVPIDAPAPPIPFLQKHGVRVNVINDNINDHWSPFGTGDMIRIANRAAEVFSMVDEISLSQAYGLVSNGLTALDAQGNRQWPNVGDSANILFTKAESTAHLIARVCPERVVMFKGEVVSGSFE